MSITAAMVKELREATGAGMMDAKKALVENDGNMEVAKDWLRKKGMAKAEKKASRVASEGMVFVTSEGNKGAMVEVNSETDFVAKNEEFKTFVNKLGALILESGETNIDAINAMTMGDITVAETLTNLIAKIGENMNIRRADVLTVESGNVAGYSHMGGKIGVLVAIESPEASDKMAETARGVAMHVAASNPAALTRDELDPELLAREKAIYEEQAAGKPENIVEKIVSGRINKFCEESCLVDQAFVMDTDNKVGQVVSNVHADAKIKAFTRFGLGDGIEKEEGDFAAEVAAAVNG